MKVYDGGSRRQCRDQKTPVGVAGKNGEEVLAPTPEIVCARGSEVATFTQRRGKKGRQRVHEGDAEVGDRLYVRRESTTNIDVETLASTSVCTKVSSCRLSSNCGKISVSIDVLIGELFDKHC